MREERDLLQRLDVGALAGAVADDRAVAARVDDETRLEIAIDDDLLRIREVDGRDRRLLTHVDALLLRVLQQEVVELRALHLERAAIRIAQAFVEAEAVADLPVAGDEVRAVLREVVAFEHLVGETEAVEKVVVVREERLADLKTREPFALEERYGEALLGEQGRGGAAGRPSSNDDDVAHRRP
jgi:hypothetical protein